MKKLIFFCFIVLLLFCPTSNSFSREPVRVDLLYMNHGPLQPTLRELDNLFVGYGNRIAVFRHDFESEEGERFMAQKGLRRHVPLVIWIDGNSTLEVNGNEVTFTGFPTGSGPLYFQGKWSIEILKEALDQITGRN